MPERDTPGTPPLAAVHRYFEISLYLLLLTSVLALVSTGKLDWLTTLAPPAALLVKGYRWWRRPDPSGRGREPELSHRAATWLVAGYFAFFPFDLWFISRGLAANAPSPLLYAALLAAIHLTLFALVVRLYSTSTTRDYLFLGLLAFATMLAAAILTVDTTFLVFFVVFFFLSASTFAALEMQRSAEGAAVAPLETGTPAARRLYRALGPTAAAVAVSALVIGAVIFFLLPRITAGYLGGFNLQPSLISGFSDNVELGQIGEIKKSTAVVMRVRVEGDASRTHDVRWRGIALTTFDGKRWFTDAHESVVVSPDADGWFALGATLRQSRGNATPLRYTVLLEPMATDALFVAAQADRVRGRFFSESAGGLATRPSFVVVDKTDSLFSPFHNFTNSRYEGLSYVPSVPPALLRATPARYPDEISQVYLQLPRLDPRIPALAEQVTSGSATAYDKAVAIELYLRERYGYTLDLTGPSGADPLAHFLFVRRAGHCEYFAAAMTVMLRTQSVPARYVNGFLPGEYNEVGDDFIVRASDAHSWVEVYFPEYGWLPFDPTPPADERAKGFLRRLALYWDWFELVWSEWVINYDFLHQATLAQNFQRTSRDYSERARAFLEDAYRQTIERIKIWQQRVLDAPYPFAVALGTLAALALLLRRSALRRLLAKFWGLNLSPRAELTPGLARLHYEEMLRLLARRGLPKSPGQTPLEFAASVPGAQLSGPVAELTDLYQTARFGARRPQARRMSELLRRVKRLLHSKPTPQQRNLKEEETAGAQRAARR